MRSKKQNLLLSQCKRTSTPLPPELHRAPSNPLLALKPPPLFETTQPFGLLALYNYFLFPKIFHYISNTLSDVSFTI